MATRKKKTEGVTLEMPGTMGGAKVVLPKTKKKQDTTWPKVVKGSHLTVTTFEDGKVKLEWDDEQLLKDVREAIASVEAKPKASAITGNIKPKKTRAKKTQ